MITVIITVMATAWELRLYCLSSDSTMRLLNRYDRLSNLITMTGRMQFVLCTYPTLAGNGLACDLAKVLKACREVLFVYLIDTVRQIWGNTCVPFVCCGRR